jgi:phosphohistidine phosphatase
MKRLILMRHAKSDWSDITASDHERALNTRGRHDAHVMGDWMSAKALQPDHVLCSDATRTRETLADLTLDDVRITFTRSLYLAEPDVMARALHTRDEPCVLIIAHNPGCGMLANMLLTNIPKHAQFNSYPTGATLVADFNIPRWQDLRHHTGSVIHFCVPRDLTV